MSRLQRVEKPLYRFTVVDDTINTWGVKDNHTGKLVRKELRSSMEARQEAEKLNINPELIDGQDQETTS
jgi:hypothetical protein